MDIKTLEISGTTGLLEIYCKYWKNFILDFNWTLNKQLKSFPCTLNEEEKTTYYNGVNSKPDFVIRIQYATNLPHPKLTSP